jgi:uncharacterized surface protein with fasciclin (FAS1) repeats
MNLKRFLSFLKHALLAVVVLATLGITGCDDDDDGPTIYNGTVLELMNDTQFKQASGASADVALDSLVKYLTLYPSLTAVLSTSTEVTLFAPSNTAFASLLATPGFPEDISLIDPDIIEGVLSYHIVPGTYLQSELTSGTALTTAYPLATTSDRINVNADGTLKTGSSNQSIVIADADNQATNGVIHVVGSVMIPQSVGATLTPILGTMAGTVLLGADFSNLADLIAKADNGFTETATSFKISTMLANPDANATWFATPNAVFSAVAGGEANVDAFINSFSQASARAVLLNHYVPGKYVVTAQSGATAFSNGLQVNAASGKQLTMSVGAASTSNPYGVAATYTITGTSTTGVAPIVSKDIVNSNGVIQVIAGIIQ